LLDLQLAEQIIRQQQLIDAIKENSLRSRPILVPIQITLIKQHIQLFIQYQKTLETLGITFQSHDNNVVITSIPSLLSQVDIKQLINAIAIALESKQTTLKHLSFILQQQCPLIAIHNLQQAESILKQLPSPDKTMKWCHILDHQTLSSLFLP
jgi:DNA mismatch repair ATPase MutL